MIVRGDYLIELMISQRGRNVTCDLIQKVVVFLVLLLV